MKHCRKLPRQELRIQRIDMRARPAVVPYNLITEQRHRS
jgi:hypothetical protein